MSRRYKDPSYDQYPHEKRGVVIASVLAAVFIVGVFLIVRGLTG